MPDWAITTIVGIHRKATTRFSLGLGVSLAILVLIARTSVGVIVILPSVEVRAATTYLSCARSLSLIFLDTDCYSLIDRGASYRGNESRTVNLFGFERECENWKDSRTNYANGSRFSSYGLNDPSVLNKCRNPNPRRFFRPWCIPKFRIDGNAVAIPCTRVSPCRTAAGSFILLLLNTRNSQ